MTQINSCKRFQAKMKFESDSPALKILI